MEIERTNGTLEIIFISPSSKLAMMYGRAIGSLFENIWMFFVFSIFTYFVFGDQFGTVPEFVLLYYMTIYPEG